MKRTRFFAAIGLIMAVGFAACTNDELMDPNTLPEGKYPLEIASVTMEVNHSQQPWGADVPQTRVSENKDGMSSHWDVGDVIHVKLGNQETTYQVTDANKGTLELVGEPIYWTKRTDNVTAWYTSPEVNGTINLADQSQKLAYVLQASAPNASFDKPVTLSFSHQLAKVRVFFNENSTADYTIASVGILAPTTCTVDQGVVTPGSTTDYIPMHKTTYYGRIYHEVSVTPNFTLDKNAFQLVIDGRTAICNANNAITTLVGHHCNIRLTVNETYQLVHMPSIANGTEYTISGNVHLKGDGSPKNVRLIVEPGSRLILDNVNLQPNDTYHSVNAITCNGSTTIKLLKENMVKGSFKDNGYIEEGAAGILINQGTLTINGPGKLVANGSNRNGAGIGAINGASIIINGGTIIATNESQVWGCPGIGASSNLCQHCGDITINGGHITATGSDAAAGIGGSVNTNCGNITIQGENTIVNATKGVHNDPYSDNEDIGKGLASTCGTVTFRNGATVNGVKYD